AATNRPDTRPQPHRHNSFASTLASKGPSTHGGHVPQQTGRTHDRNRTATILLPQPLHPRRRPHTPSMGRIEQPGHTTATAPTQFFCLNPCIQGAVHPPRPCAATNRPDTRPQPHRHNSFASTLASKGPSTHALRTLH